MPEVSIGTAILVVGLGFIAIVAAALVFAVVQFNRERKRALREFEERRRK